MNKKVGTAYSAFFDSFKYYIPSLELIRDNVEKFDLIIFPGGEDINPNLYGQKNRFSYYNDIRDSKELKVLQKALELNKKIFGACRGHQLINAFLGGELTQDINLDLHLNHTGDHELIPVDKHLRKMLTLPKLDSIIFKFFDDVNSLHHQGVVIVGEGLIPTSFYNGVYESCESKNIITVQFHPEFMNNSKSFFNFLVEEW